MKLLKYRRPVEVRIFFKKSGIVKIDVNVSSAGKKEKKGSFHYCQNWRIMYVHITLSKREQIKQDLHIYFQ